MRKERYYRMGMDEEYIRKLEKEIEFEDSRLTEKERQARAKEDRERICMAFDKAQCIQNASRLILNEDKARKFREIYENMFEFAEKMMCDIVVESDEETKGTITLVFNYLLFDSKHTREELHILWDMLSNADMTTCHTKDGLANLRSYFSLADTLYMKSLL